MNYESMMWAAAWGFFTAVVTTPALDLEPAACLLVTIVGAAIITIAMRR